MTKESTVAGRRYELMVIVAGDKLAKDIDAQLDRVRKLISEQKGEIFFEDIWGKRELSYRIKKNETGYYAIFYFNFDPQNIKVLEENMRIEKDLIRFMTQLLPDDYEVAKVDLTEPKKEEKKPEARPAAKPAPKPKPKPAPVVVPVKEEEPAKEEVKEEVK